MTWEEFLTTKTGLWVDTHPSTDNTLHGRGRGVEKSSILRRTEKQLKAVMVMLHAICSVLKRQ